MQRLRAEDRPATPAEQQTLSRYVGWGGLPQAFDFRNKDWENEFQELSDLLSAEDYAKARRSTQDAHYTPVQVIEAMYQGLDRLGFTGGRTLDAGAGTGHFFGCMPEHMRANTQFTAIEVDPTTAAIGGSLYPGATYINRGYEQVFVPREHFDCVVGNPPYGSQSLYDAEHRELSDYSIHNYFIAKSIDKLRPGGVLAVVVSRYFMDAQDTKARARIADQAHLLGAIRLPNTTFKENALTEVTTDIVFFQKAREGESINKRWVEVEPFPNYDSDSEIVVNRYYVDHPAQMLGNMTMVKGMHGDKPELLPLLNGHLPTQLAEAIQILPQNVYTAVDRSAEARLEAKEDLTLPESLKVGSYFVLASGQLARRLPDILEKHDYEVIDPRNARAGERMKGMVGIRDTLRRLMTAELTDDHTSGPGESGMTYLRAELNRRYDKFVAKHGHISAQANRLAMQEDPEYPLLFALERDYDKGISVDLAKKQGVAPREPSAQKAAIFERRVLTARREVTTVESAKDALVVSMNERGRVDLDYMVRLARKSEDEVLRDLTGLIYHDPAEGQWVTADRYLTGNVKRKLAEATAAAEKDPAYAGNADALRAVLPADIEAVDIAVQLGSAWVPAATVAEFTRHLLGDVRTRIHYQSALGKWTADVGEGEHTRCRVTWGTQRYPANDLIEAILQQKSIAVRDQVQRNPPLYQINQVETAAANQKADEIRQAFLDWIWDDKDRRTQLAALYNERFNTNVVPRYDGSHLSMEGASVAISFRPHQKDAVWRGIQEGSTLWDHRVGAGKTFVLCATLMESKRMGLMHKPMLVVPNHLLLQWKDAFYQLYPNANILVADKTDFDKDNRQRLFAKIATNDWDAVIVAHSSFKKIGVPAETLEVILQEQITDLTHAILAAKEENGDRVTIKEMEKTKERMEERMKRAADTGAKDRAITFDELGVDALAVDEAHEFKNLQITTSLSRVGGLGNLAGSEKAFDLFVKCRYLQQKHNGRGVFFATGTPISNTIAEMFTMQRYMRYDDMRERGIAHFDAWASTFGQVVTGWELDATGVNYRLNSRFAKFQNVPELVNMYRTFADVITQADLDRQAEANGTRFPVPKLKGGRPINVVVERSPLQAQFMGIQTVINDADGQPMRRADGVFVKQWNQGSIIHRMENLPKDPRIDNPLKITNEARKAGLDMRLIDPDLPDHPDSKVNACVDRLMEHYHEWKDDRGTQLVFCDLSTPKGAKFRDAPPGGERSEEGEGDDEAADSVSMDELLAGSGPFSVYDDLKQKLIDRGVPADEIRFIHEAKTDLQKEKLFQEMNRGTVRFLFGSTAKMGAGTNVQRKIVAIHHLDAPWRPSDLEQREGRGIRQGNEFYERDPDGFELAIYRYATKQTYDSRMWQTIEYKAAGIEQFRRGDSLTRTIEDIASEAANAAEMKAAATGNPLIFMQVRLSADLKKMEAAFANHQRGHHMLERRIDWLKEADQRADRLVERWKAEIALRDAHPKDGAVFVLPSGKRLGEDDRAVLLEHTMSCMKKALDEAAVGSSSDIPVGTYRGFKILVYCEFNKLSFVVAGHSDYESDNLRYGRDERFSATGLITKLDNYLSSFEGRIEKAVRACQDERAELTRAMVEVTRPFAQMSKLEDLRADVRDVLAELRHMQGDESYLSTWSPRTDDARASQAKPLPEDRQRELVAMRA